MTACEVCGLAVRRPWQVYRKSQKPAATTLADWCAEYERKKQQGLEHVIYIVDTCGSPSCVKTAHEKGNPNKTYEEWVRKEDDALES